MGIPKTMTSSFTHVMNGSPKRQMQILNVINHVKGSDLICDCMEFGEL